MQNLTIYPNKALVAIANEISYAIDACGSDNLIEAMANDFEALCAELERRDVVLSDHVMIPESL